MVNEKQDDGIKFTIDGRVFVINDPKQSATSLLDIAGLPADGYDLARLVGNRPDPKRFSDDEKVNVRKNDRFVSIRESAPVA